MTHRARHPWVWGWVLSSAICVHAQTLDPQTPALTSLAEASGAASATLPPAIAEQRQALSLQREAIMQAYEKQQKICWQKFAVNACLSEARRIRRQGIDSIHQQELVLNAQERAWRTEQRTLRLQGKQVPSKDAP